MCGIAGIVSLNGRAVRDARRRMTAMLDCMRHRGPDRSGTWISDDGLVAFGNTRLAIVDVMGSFDVPLRSNDNAAVLTYNGEVFNHREIHSHLESDGVRFKTRSDTEVFLEGFRRYKIDFLGRLDGFWGFGFYDAYERELYLGRDLLGEKHVFYFVNDSELIFSSEANPVLIAAGTHLSLDLDAVAAAFRFRVAPPGRTLVKGLKRLPPGMVLKAIPGRHELTIHRALRLKPEKWIEFFARQPSENQVLDVYETALSEACRIRIPDEVAFKTTLSGGLDSALVNLFASDYGRRKISSLYGVSTEKPPNQGDALDELAASQFTAKVLNTNHRVFSMIEDDCVGLYKQQASNCFDGLICEGAVCYQQLAQQVSATGGRVLIVSDGPDELIGGYDVDLNAYRQESWARQNPVLGSFVRALSSRQFSLKFFPGDERKKLTNWSYLRAMPFRFRPIHGGTTAATMDRLFDPSVVSDSLWHYGTIDEDYQSLCSQLDLSQRMALSYATQSLPDYFNLRSDRGSMRESVELRLPMQSPALVELMIGTPASWRFRDAKWSKYILRRLVERHIGPEVAYRHKYGFAYPAWQMPRLRPLFNFTEIIRNSSVLRSIGFDNKALDFLCSPGEERHAWMAYCIAQTGERLRQCDFSIATSPANFSNSHAAASA